MKLIYSLLLLMTLSCQSSTNAKDYSDYHKKAQAYCKANAMNDNYYFLLDLSIHSGRNRFFIYDFNQNKVVDQNIVTHGACDHFETNVAKYQTAKFSSRVDSHCSMKGKFKIGKRDYSTWGINVKYWLHGLEEQNKNAVDRVIVLHSWTRVANKEIFPRYSPLSWGCPAVSNAFMRKLDTRLQTAQTPVLLWIIE